MCFVDPAVLILKLIKKYVRTFPAYKYFRNAAEKYFDDVAINCKEDEATQNYTRRTGKGDGL